MKVSSASPLTAEQYCQTPTCLSSASASSPTPLDQCVNAMCWPSGKASPSSRGPRHRLELLRQVVGALRTCRRCPQLVHLVVVVGDGLVVPEDRVAVLEVVHEHLRARAGRPRCRACGPCASRVFLVLAEGRRGVRVVDRRCPAATCCWLPVGLLGGDVLADTDAGAPISSRPRSLNCAQVPPVLDRLVGRDADDQQRDQHADADDRSAAAACSALFCWLADLVDDRLAVGLVGLGHDQASLGWTVMSVGGQTLR